MRAIAVTLVVACTPQLLLLGSGLADAQVGQRMEHSLRYLVGSLSQELAANPTAEPGHATAEHALQGGAWVRVLDAEGRLLSDVNRDGGPTGLNRLGQVVFGPDGAPTLAQSDAALPPLAQRAEVRDAQASPSSRCDRDTDPRLMVCSAVVRVSTPTGPRVVHAQQGSRRAIRALYDLRYQVLKLTVFSGLAAAGLGAWLAARIVLPLRTLREEVEARVSGPVRTQPIPLRREDEIGDVALAFNRLLEALEGRNRSYERFVEDLVHEMKSPVAAIRAAAESMDGRTPDEARARRLARVLRQSSARLDELVTHFLELARAEGGLRAQDRAPLALTPLAQALCEQLTQTHPGLRVRCTEEAPLPAVWASAPHLSTALRNLLENAAAFAGPEGEVDLTLRPTAEGVSLELRDSGPGIPPEHLPRVFERFFTTRPRGEGTGLGLPMARALIEAHGGTLTAVSPPGSGAIFTIWLPTGG